MANFLALLVILFFSSGAMAEKWRIATLEWPPYTCSNCPGQGAGCKALRELLNSVGVEVEFEFYPWVRAIKEGGSKDFIGYFPAWIEEIKDGFVASPAIFKSPLGFLELKNRPLSLKKISDLKDKSIGGVSGYGYTNEFLKLGAEGFFKLHLEYSDELNIKALLRNRLDGLIIDVINAEYFLKRNFAKEASKLNISKFVLDKKGLYLSINKHSANAANAKFEKAFKKVNSQSVVDEWLIKNKLSK